MEIQTAIFLVLFTAWMLTLALLIRIFMVGGSQSFRSKDAEIEELRRRVRLLEAELLLRDTAEPRPPEERFAKPSDRFTKPESAGPRD